MGGMGASKLIYIVLESKKLGHYFINSKGGYFKGQIEKRISTG